MSNDYTCTGGIHVEVTLSVETPHVPNFVRLNVNGKRTTTVSIADMSDAQLKQLGDSWTKKLIERAKELRKQGP